MSGFGVEQFDEFFGADLCFCKSGQKYQNCHRKKKYKNPQEIYHDQNLFMHRTRLCPVIQNGEECGSKTIASHSQKRRGVLSEITEKGHVAGFSNGPNAARKSADQLTLTAISAKKASTFPGLCNKHDTELYKDIEAKPLIPRYSVALGLALRCAFYEAVTHTDAMLFLNWLSCVPEFDFSMNMEAQALEIRNMEHYSAYNWELVSTLNKIQVRRSHRRLIFFCALLDSVLPFSATGCFCIENDLQGNQLQPFSDTTRKFSYAQLSVLPQKNGTTLLAVSSTNDQDVVSSENFIRSFGLCNKSDLANAFLRVALEHTENIYFQPSWLDKLEQRQRHALIERFDDSKYHRVGAEKPRDSISRPLDLAIAGEVLKTSTNLAARK